MHILHTIPAFLFSFPPLLAQRRVTFPRMVRFTLGIPSGTGPYTKFRIEENLLQEIRWGLAVML